MPLNPAHTLDEIRENCSPKPLTKENLSSFFVATDDARDERSNLRQRLADLLNRQDTTKRLLVYGHRGCGKSTELNQLKEDLGDRWFIVSLSILDFTNGIGIKAEDILLAVAVALFEQAGAPGLDLPVDDSHLAGVHAFFNDVTETEVAQRMAQVKIGAGAGAKDGSLWDSLIGLSAYFRSELKFATDSNRSAVHKVRQRPSELSVAVNLLIEAIQSGLDRTGRRLLLVVEDLDKLMLADAHEVFVRNGKLLGDLNTNAIFTIPIFTFYSPDADAIRAYFDEDVHFQMVKVVDLEGQLAKGYEVLKQIVRKRVAPEALDDIALDLLIRRTGGVLRHVFDTLQTASAFSNLRHGRISRDDIRFALNKVRDNLGVQIGWPRDKDGNGRDPKDLYQRLAEIAVAQSEKKRVPPQNDPFVQVLLQSGALIEYNGERWLGVHPLAREFLTALGQEVGADPYGP